MPIPQLTRSPRGWEKYKRRIKHRGFLQATKTQFFNLFLKQKKGTWLKMAKTVIILGVIGFLLGGIAFVGAVAWYSHDLPDPNGVIDRVVLESTKIYDRKGESLLWEIHGDEKRTVIELDQISPFIIHATLAAEDRHFYEHHGINFFSIIQAVILDPLRGKGVRGGSTLTQQFVKNAILTNERKISRKMKEWILSHQIERKFTKEQILKMYFNEIPYGSVNYGVEAASNYFFSKSAKDVTLAEAAILAAIPQAPTRLSPYGSNIDQLFSRQRWILDQMAEIGSISKEEAKIAKEEEIDFKKANISGITAPHFVFYVKQILAEKLGETTVDQGGLKVITTLDIEKQQIAEEAVHNSKERLNQYGAGNAALLSVDAKTGEILAMVGSMDFNDKEIHGQVNVTIMPRQPGSSIKPVGYAAALAKGFTTETVLYDVATTFPAVPENYSPKNYDSKERGPITIRRALGGSLNIPAVKVLYLAGIENVKTLMKNLGYSTINDKSPCGLSLVLGGCEVKLIDHVGAFTTFARDGERAEVAAILKVEDKTGKILEEFQPKKHNVLDSNTTRQINSILSDDEARAWAFGAGSNLTLPGRPVCAKTGTTNNNNDAWTIGYTPSFVAGVWVGNSDGTDMKGSATGAGLASPIWNEYMRKILEGTPVEYFKAPEEISEELQPILRGQSPSDMEIEIDKASGKLATPLTPLNYIEKKKFNQHRSILYYVNKNDPQGPSPENPENDPMFAPWEEAIKKWAEKIALEQGVELSADQAPTEFDDLHIPQNIPTITLISPGNNQTIDFYPIKLQTQASAPRGISKIIYEIDNQVIGMATSYPYELELNYLDTANGYHKIKATVYDDIDNSASVEIEVNLKLPYAAPEINWISPRQNASFYMSNFPLNINFSLTKTKGVKKIDFYYNLLGGGQATKLAEIYDITTEPMSINWQNITSNGSYEIYAQFTEDNDEISQSNSLSISILE